MTPKYQKSFKYTVLHMFTQLLFWAGNQGDHQNFDPSLLLKETLTYFHGNEAKKSYKMTDSKKN